ATVPGSPTGVAASAGDHVAVVSFDVPVSDGDAPITTYTVTASPGGATVTGSTSPLSVTGLSNGVAYTFTVVATNSAGDSAPSNPSAPASPASGAIALGIGEWYVGFTQIHLTTAMFADTGFTWEAEYGLTDTYGSTAANGGFDQAEAIPESNLTLTGL